MPAPGVIVEIDEQENTRWVTHTDGKHYPFSRNKGHKETVFEYDPHPHCAIGGMYLDDSRGYAEFKARQQVKEQQNG